MRLILAAAAAVLMASPAFAGDTNWSGFYLGAQAGGMWGDVSVRDNADDGVDPGPFNYSVNGGVIGATGGYNWQFGQFVTGLEGNLTYVAPNGFGKAPSSAAPGYQTLSVDSGLLADLTARLGYSFDKTLIYAKGGYSVYTGDALQKTPKAGYEATPTGNLHGWTLGAGVEHMVTEKISLKLDYQHFFFQSADGYQTNVGSPDDGTPIGYRFSNEHDVGFDIVKLGFAVHF